MHVAAADQVTSDLIPSMHILMQALEDKAGEFYDVIKIGRTHLQDAVPLTVGQEWSGYAAQLDYAAGAIEAARPGLLELAAGGTAVPRLFSWSAYRK